MGKLCVDVGCMRKEVAKGGGARSLQNVWGRLLPAGHKGRVSDVRGAGHAEATFSEASEQFIVVLGSQRGL